MCSTYIQQSKNLYPFGLTDFVSFLLQVIIKLSTCICGYVILQGYEGLDNYWGAVSLNLLNIKVLFHQFGIFQLVVQVKTGN